MATATGRTWQEGSGLETGGHRHGLVAVGDVLDHVSHVQQASVGSIVRHLHTANTQTGVPARLTDGSAYRPIGRYRRLKRWKLATSLKPVIDTPL